MELLAYIKPLPRRHALAVATERSPHYLYQVATNRRRASAELARAIEDATNGEVTRASLRPDIWAEEVSEAA
jgi:DNA-binding transcriptional regulator YdaS (Cro superfamily)